jgi:Flp pilus assembly protein TadG
VRRRLAWFVAERGGAATVEFAMVLVPLLLLIFGIFEFGRLLWTREALQETATAGGSYSAANTTSYIEGVASNWGMTLASANIALNSNATCAGVTAANGFSNVTITYTFQSIAPDIVTALSGGTTLTTTACFPNY